MDVLGTQNKLLSTLYHTGKCIHVDLVVFTRIVGTS